VARRSTLLLPGVVSQEGATVSDEQIEEFIRTRPFRRFYLEAAGGNYVEVESERHIALPPAGHDLILVYGTDGIVHHLDKNEILNAAVYGPVPHNDK
jgi:hypothetical protein